MMVPLAHPDVKEGQNLRQGVENMQYNVGLPAPTGGIGLFIHERY